MKVYLDLCAIQRPLDTPNQVRIVLEAEAVLGILNLVDSGQVELVSSEVLVYETDQNPLEVRKEHATAILGKAKSNVNITKSARERATQFSQDGIQALDALHLALAESSEADYFCTCDDQLLRKANRIADLRVKVISSIDLIQEIEK